jgi:hypothetical protein
MRYKPVYNNSELRTVDCKLPTLVMSALGVPHSPLNVHSNPPPLPLIESHNAEYAPRKMSDENRDPDVNRIQRADPLNHEANAEWDENL